MVKAIEIHKKLSRLVQEAKVTYYEKTMPVVIAESILVEVPELIHHLRNKDIGLLVIFVGSQESRKITGQRAAVGVGEGCFGLLEPFDGKSLDLVLDLVQSGHKVVSGMHGNAGQTQLEMFEQFKVFAQDNKVEARYELCLKHLERLQKLKALIFVDCSKLSVARLDKPYAD
jgi:hypothetical protein